MADLSFKFIARASKKNADGLIPIYLQFFAQGERTRLSMGQAVPLSNWDAKKELVRSGGQITDAAAKDINMLLMRKAQKLNDIKYEARLREETLSKADVIRLLDTTGPRNDFHNWVSRKIDELVPLRDSETIGMYRNTFTDIKDWRPVLRFADLTPDLPDKYEVWLRGRGLRLNTRGKHHSHLRTFCNMLRKEVKGIPDTYAWFSVKKAEGERAFLNRDEVNVLVRMFDQRVLGDSLHNHLGMFLFSCHSGLRFSDLVRVRHDQVVDGFLSFIPFKKRGLEKRCDVPMAEDIMRFAHTHTGTIFNWVSDQKFNEALKTIAQSAGIRKHLTAHVGRHTFATGYILRGGKQAVLSKILGHAKSETTDIYVHMAKEALEEERCIVDTLFLPIALQKQ